MRARAPSSGSSRTSAARTPCSPAAGSTAGLTCRRLGPPLLFGRLWEDTGCRAVLDGLLAGRAFEFPVERAIFAAVLHRLMAPGSDRACERWLADYAVPGAAGLALHHFYRAMARLGEELAAPEQAAATPFAPRTVKDLVEERLFERRRDLLGWGHIALTGDYLWDSADIDPLGFRPLNDPSGRLAAVA